MATNNPRITVTLTPAVHAILRELSSLSGTSQSATVAELLEASAPVLERVVITLRAASTVRDDANAQILAGLSRAQDKLQDQLDLALSTLDEGSRPLIEEAEKVKRRARKAVLTPVPVTRGSGHPKHTKTGPSTHLKRAK